jgi:hypothetical protein
MVPRWPLQRGNRATRPTTREHLLFIVARVEYLRHDAGLMVVVLSGLGQLRSDVEFLVLIESQTLCMRGLELFHEQILNDEHVIGLYTRDAARTLPLDLQLGHTSLAVFRDNI